MERLLSDEEKIRKAIEISQRRNGTNTVQRTTEVRNNKKDYRLFKKMVLQIIICLLLYMIFYLITTTNYIFSDEVINKATSILNYDIKLNELYIDSVNKINTLINNWKVTDSNQNNEVENQSLNQENTMNVIDENNQLEVEI